MLHEVSDVRCGFHVWHGVKTETSSTVEFCWTRPCVAVDITCMSINAVATVDNRTIGDWRKFYHPVNVDECVTLPDDVHYGLCSPSTQH